MTTRSATIRLFLGDHISNAAEAACIRRLQQDLAAARTDAVILANFTLGPKRRQIDLVVATVATAIVVEMKNYIHPVHGTVNGPWWLELDDGGRRDLGTTNPYQQALENRFTVTDGLRGEIGADVRDAVGGMLCLYPVAAPGSMIPQGDFKVAIGSYADLLTLLQEPRPNAIDLTRWQRFAETQGLKDQSANGLTAAEASIAQYIAAYEDLGRATLGPFIEPLFDGEHSTATLAVRSANGEQLQIIGPSGSGKTELLKRLGIEAARRGNIPVMVRARDFVKDLAPLLKADVARYTRESVQSLFRAAEHAGAEIILHVDALNECPSNKRGDLIAALQAARINYCARILLSGQNAVTLPASLAGETIHLIQPNDEQAELLVVAHLGRALTEAETGALEVVATTHDATILAAMLDQPNTIDGRFSRYHGFTRARLKAAGAPQADRGLADLATAMRTGFVATMPRAAVERIVDASNGLTTDAASSAGILWADGNRVGFRHDLIGDFFAAEAILRRASGPVELDAMARLPIHAELREFLLGGCATTQEIATLLSNAPDSRLLRSALTGRAGAKARDYVISRMRDVIGQLKRSYVEICMAVPDGVTSARELVSLEPSFPDERDDGEIEGAYLGLIPYALTELLPDLLDMFAAVDRRLYDEAERLRAKHADIRVAWRAASYGSLYGMHHHPGARHLQNLLHAIQNSWSSDEGAADALDLAPRLDAFESLSVGQLFLLVTALRRALSDTLPSRFPELLRHIWRTQVYHLRLIFCDIIRFRGRELEEEDREAVRDILNEFMSDDNILLNSIVIDALEGVDGIVHEFTVEAAVEEYEAMLALPETPESRSLAVSAVTRTYDHPFRDEYWEAFYDVLAVEKRQALLLRGLRDQPGDPWFIADILRALRRDPTPDAEPELQHLAQGPRLDGHSHQYAVVSYAEAIGLLAELDLPLNRSEPPPADPTLRAWYMAAPLIHALNAKSGADLPKQAIEALLACGTAEAFDVVQRLAREARNLGFSVNTAIAFETRWPDMVLQLARAVLAKGYVAASVFARFHFSRSLEEDHVDAALQMMAKVGRPTDLALVQTWLDHPVHGEQALATARALEAERVAR